MERETVQHWSSLTAAYCSIATVQWWRCHLQTCACCRRLHCMYALRYVESLEDAGKDVKLKLTSSCVHIKPTSPFCLCLFSLCPNSQITNEASGLSGLSPSFHFRLQSETFQNSKKDVKSVHDLCYKLKGLFPSYKSIKQLNKLSSRMFLMQQTGGDHRQHHVSSLTIQTTSNTFDKTFTNQ